MGHPDPQTSPPLILLAGPTASGKTALAIDLAQRFNGEIISCDSVAVYSGMEIGTAKPSSAERALVPHHLLDVVSPDQPFTAGDFSRLARLAIADITARGRLPIVAGGTGLYLRALTEGLFPAPPVHPKLRLRLRQRATARGPAYLHRLLLRLDPASAGLIHPNDAPKLIRALEVTLAARQPISRQWQAGGRDALQGFRILRLTLAPPRPDLYTRINARAAAMFDRGLVEETRALLDRFGPSARALSSLGYRGATQLLRGELTLAQAIETAQQGHRNYAKRQATWFRRDTSAIVLPGFGSDPEVLASAHSLVREHLTFTSAQ